MFIKKFLSGANSLSLDDFLGISPDQMFRIIYGEFEDIEDICSFNSNFSPTLLDEVSAAKQMRLLLKLVEEAGEAKATRNGFLPKKIVNAVFEFPIRKPDGTPYTIQSEGELPLALALRYSATDCGWLKIRNGKFSLTKEGKKVVERNFGPGDYLKLMKHWMRTFSWSFADGYAPCVIVQSAAVFSLYALHLKARSFYPFSNYLDIFLRAFPMALDDVDLSRLHLWDEKEQVSQVLKLRFLERFCVYFGLVECAGSLETYKTDKTELKVRITPLFQQVFFWLPAEKRKLFFDEPFNSTKH